MASTMDPASQDRLRAYIEARESGGWPSRQLMARFALWLGGSGSPTLRSETSDFSTPR